MTRRSRSHFNATTDFKVTAQPATNIQSGYSADALAAGQPGDNRAEMLDVIGFLEAFAGEVETSIEPSAPNPYFNMAMHLMRSHLEGRIVTASALVAASGVPYATAMRKLGEMQKSGLIEQRPRTRSGRSFSLHPSAELIQKWSQLSDRLQRIAQQTFGGGPATAGGGG